MVFCVKKLNSSSPKNGKYSLEKPSSIISFSANLTDSNTIGWNTFPISDLTEKNRADLTKCAEDIILARESYFPATIADLYESDAMPQNLRDAHERNDEVLERIYIGRKFKNDTERLEKLFELYTKMTSKKWELLNDSDQTSSVRFS